MRKRRTSNKWEDVQAEAIKAGLQPTGKWVSWIQNNQFDGNGCYDGIMGKGYIYGGKAHCLTDESDFKPDGWEFHANPLKEGATFLCKQSVPQGVGEDIYEWHHKGGLDSFGVPRHAPRGYCKRCVKALKKREQKSR